MSLKAKMEELALIIADALLGDHIELADRIDGLKTLSGYYATVKRADSGDRTTVGRWGELAAALEGSNGAAGNEKYGASAFDDEDS